MSHVTSLQSLSKKLGLKSANLCIAKACEYNELLETRVSAASLTALRLPGDCKLVICLDLAAKDVGVSPNQNDLVRQSGMNKKSYTETVKVVSALLGVEERTTLRELAVHFCCSKVVPEAADILKRYTKHQCSDVDYGSPMFLCAALLVAAKNEKVKIDAVKLRERAGAKKMTFDRLVGEMQKYVVATAEPKKTSGAKRGGLIDAIDAQIQDDERRAKVSKLDGIDEDDNRKTQTQSEDSYAEWKKRILAQAAQASS